MQTSRNPKVLNHALRYKTRSILDKVAALESKRDSVNEFIAEKESAATELMNDVNANKEKYESQQETVIDQINKANNDLTSLIKNKLYNPNVNTSEETESGGGEETKETNYITDKIIKACQYGFVVDGKDVVLYSISGKGITIGEQPVTDTKEYTFFNPGNDDIPFPSYYVNDILKDDPEHAVLSTSTGIVLYDVYSGNYKIRSTDYGLPNKEVLSVIKVKTSDGLHEGYLAATKKGLAFSPTGEGWTVVDRSFKEECTCLSSTGKLNTPQTLVFIGTTSGVYYLNFDDYFNEESENKKVVLLSNYSQKLPSTYINSLSYNTKKDILISAGLGGISVLNNASTYANSEAGDISASDYANYTSGDGLTGTTCYSVLWTSSENKLIVGTSNGLSITTDFRSWTQITRIANSENVNSDQRLVNHVCNKIVREGTNLYTILHGVGLTESIEISN